MADTSWMNNPKLKNIDPHKMAILLEIVKEAEGKSMEQLIPLLMSVNKRLQQQHMTITKDESDLMLDAITKNLSPKEKAQFEMIKRFMANRK
jgi:predicted transglutaminase-like cysteine proteinase